MKFIILIFSIYFFNCYADENSGQLPMHFYYEWIHPKKSKDIVIVNQEIKFYSDKKITPASKPVIILSHAGIRIFNKYFSMEEIKNCFESSKICEKNLKDATFIQRDGKSLLVHLFYEDDFLQSINYEGNKFYSNLKGNDINVVFDDAEGQSLIEGVKSFNVFKNMLIQDNDLKKLISKIKSCANNESYSCLFEASKIDSNDELLKSLKIRESMERTMQESKVKNLERLGVFYKFDVRGDDDREPLPKHVYDKVNEYPHAWKMIDRIFDFKDGTYGVTIQPNGFQLQYFTIVFKTFKNISYKNEYEAKIVFYRNYDNDRPEWVLQHLWLYPICVGDSCE